MSGYRTFDLYLIQDPNNLPKTLLQYDPNTEDHPRGYDENLLKHFSDSIPVRNVSEFVGRIIAEAVLRKRLLKTLVIGSHGGYTVTGSSGIGYFYIGDTYISSGDGSKDEREVMKRVAPYFANDARVYILACRSGNDRDLLRKVSEALGGVRVHGYTDYITVANYGPFGTSLDDGTEREGTEYACLRAKCKVIASHGRR